MKRERLLAIGRGHDRIAFLLEVEAKEIDDVTLVVDDQDRLHPAKDSEAPVATGRGL
jgi:hypothetical protein